MKKIIKVLESNLLLTCVVANIFGVIIIYIMSLIGHSYRETKTKELILKGYYSVAEIIDYNNGARFSERTFKYTFLVMGKKYRGMAFFKQIKNTLATQYLFAPNFNPRGLFGHKFKVLYLPNDPDENLIDFNQEVK